MSAPESASIPNQPNDKAHCFCPVLAKQYGEEAAVILQGLGYKVAKSSKIRNDRKWHYDTLEALQKRWPYLSRSGIHGILEEQLTAGNVFKGNYNKNSFDRTGWYSVTEVLQKRAMQNDGKLWFDVPAAKLSKSIVAGTLYHNLRYHLLVFLASNPDFAGIPYHQVNKAELARILPWSESTVKREYKELVTHNLISQNPENAKQYTICNEADLVVPETMKIGSHTDMRIGSSVEMTGSSPDKIVSSTDEIGSSTDNNTHYKPLKKHINKHHYQNAALVGVGVCSSKKSDKINQLTSSTVPGQEKSHSTPLSLDKLRQLISSLSNQLTTPELKHVTKLAADFAQQYSEADFYIPLFGKIQQVTDMNDTIQLLSPFLADFLDGVESEFNIASIAAELLYYSMLEIMTGACLRFHHDFGFIKTQFPNRADTIERCHVLILEFPKYTHISAQEKADVLLHEIRFSNKNKWPVYGAGEWIKFSFPTSNSAIERAVVFFEGHEDLSAYDVWNTIAGCIELAKTTEAPEGYDKLFHARRGVTPAFLFTHWDKIAEELDAYDLLE